MNPKDEPGQPRGSLRALLRYARPHRGVLLCSLVLSLLAGAAGLALPLVTRHVLDSLGVHGGVRSAVVLLAGLLVAEAALTGLNAWLQQRTSERVVRHVRRGLVFRLVRLQVAELDTRQPGDLVARVTSDSILLKSAATTGIVMVIEGVLTLGGALVLMAMLHRLLLGATMVGLAAIAAVLTVVLPRIRQAVVRAQESVGAVGAALDRTLGAARTVKANGAEQRETDLANAAVEGAYQAGLTAARYGAVVTMVSGLSIQLAFLVVLGLGGALVSSGDLALSALIAFLLYLFYLSGPINSLVNGAGMLQQGLGAVARIEEVAAMGVEEGVDRSPFGRPSPEPPQIEIRGVTFTYPDRSAALLNVSFTARAGRQTALVGPSGAGKTTLFALLQRFYKPDRGTICLDGRDIATMPLAEVRKRIAYVEQDSPALAGTIRDNLLYAAPAVTDGEIAEVLRATRLDEFVESLQHGLETTVGPRGVTLSGGERQRLAIARALLRQPQVLLLDEVTAQLDARNERALRDVVSRAAERCTVIVIAHRLSTVTEVDQIVVLEHGMVRGCGTHTMLVNDDDLYRELATTQLLAGERGGVAVPASAAT